MHKNVKYDFEMKNISNLVVNVIQKKKVGGGSLRPKSFQLCNFVM